MNQYVEPIKVACSISRPIRPRISRKERTPTLNIGNALATLQLQGVHVSMVLVSHLQPIDALDRF